MVRTARCLCEALSVRVDGDPEIVAVCHCEFCQRRSGSAFGVSTYFGDAQVLEISGETSCYERIQDGGSHLRYYFCPVCSAGAHWTTEWLPGKLGISLGAFFDPQFPRPDRIVMTKHAQPWVSLPSDIPSFDDMDGT